MLAVEERVVLAVLVAATVEVLVLVVSVHLEVLLESNHLMEL